MIDEHFRKILPAFTTSLIDLYRKLHITPNQISLAGFGGAILAACLVAMNLPWLAIIVWWLSRLLDGTDGIYARETNQESPFGAYLDILCDMAAYSIMIFGFSFLFPVLINQWLTILFLYILCITSALSLGAIQERHNIDAKDNRGILLAAGLAEGGETGIAYTLFLIFPAQIELLVIIWIFVLLTTVIARTILARRILVNA